MNTEVYTVSALNSAVRSALENQFETVQIEGELTNLARPVSGHVYFTLKDSHAQVACALFKYQAQKIALLRDILENGAQVRVSARVTLYEPRGNYQLIIETLQLAGVGALEALFQARLNSLRKQGWFDRPKQPIPSKPRCIGVITSSSGAALHDVLTTLSRRNPLLNIIIYPSLVQGDAAVAELITQLQTANTRAECDALLLVRGGGSLEDLWCYNDPALVEAIAQSRLPIITGIGHQTDTTLADLAADLRAPTPTAAAEQVSLSLVEQLNDVDYKIQLQNNRLKNFIYQKQQQLDHLQQRLDHNAPNQQLQLRLQQLTQVNQRLHQLGNTLLKDKEIQFIQADTRLSSAMIATLDKQERTFAHLLDKLNLLSPLNVLQRGYAIATKADGKSLTQIEQVKPQDSIQIRLQNGTLYCQVIQRRKNKITATGK